MTTAAAWRIRGNVMEACNCNVTCPCNFGGDPTQLPCEAILGFNIVEGNYGQTQLGNLNVVLTAVIPGNLMEGNWTMGAYIDQRANHQQMEALGTILSGQAGGWFAAVTALISNSLPPKQVPINFEPVSGGYRIVVPGLLEVGAEQIPDPMSGEPLDTQVTGLSVPFYDGAASVRRSSVFKLTDSPLSFEHPGKSSLIGTFDYTGP